MGCSDTRYYFHSPVGKRKLMNHFVLDLTQIDNRVEPD
jgi:hypothetical protein